MDEYVIRIALPAMPGAARIAFENDTDNPSDLDRSLERLVSQTGDAADRLTDLGKPVTGPPDLGEPATR